MAAKNIIHLVNQPVEDFDSEIVDIKRMQISLKTAKIVAITANAMLEDVAESKWAGCDEHISKPIKKNLLYELVNNL